MIDGKWMQMILSLMVGMVVPSSAFAHEGHSHDAPARRQAPKGGIIKSLEQVWVEVVPKGAQLKIYLYDKEMKPRATEGFKIQAQAELPRKKGKHDLQLSDTGLGYDTEFEAKGSHRYTLILKIRDPKEKHEDTLNFTIEPKLTK